MVVFVDEDLFVIANIKCYYYSLKITILCVNNTWQKNPGFTDKDPNSCCFYCVSSPHLHSERHHLSASGTIAALGLLMTVPL